MKYQNMRIMTGKTGDIYGRVELGRKAADIGGRNGDDTIETGVK